MTHQTDPVEVEHVDHQWIPERHIGDPHWHYTCTLCGKTRRVRFECPGTEQVDGL